MICKGRGFPYKHRLGSTNCIMLTKPTQGKSIGNKSSNNDGSNNVNHDTNVSGNPKLNSKSNANVISNEDKNDNSKDKATGSGSKVEITSNKILTGWSAGIHGDEAAAGVSEKADTMEVEDGF